MTNQLDNIFENTNYIIIINSINKKLKFHIDFNEETSQLCLKKKNEHNNNNDYKNGWIEKIFLNIFHKQSKQENILYIGSSSENERKRIIN